MFKQFKHKWRELRGKRKQLQLQLARSVWDRAPDTSDFDPAMVKRVLLLRWDDKLGDSVMASLFITALADARPDIDITCVTGPICARFLRDCPGINDLQVCGRRGWSVAHSFRDLPHHYDVVVELTSGMSAYELYALHCINADHYLGFDKDDYELFDLQVSANDLHFSKRYLNAAELIAGVSVSPRFWLPQTTSADAAASDWVSGLRSCRPDCRVVLINLFAAGRHRNFSKEQAQLLLQRWLAAWPTHLLVLLVVPGKEHFVDELVTEFASERLVAAPGIPSMELTVAMVKHTDLLFSTDTFVVHVASALNSPVVAIYGDDQHNYDAWRPVSDLSAVVFTRAPKSSGDRVNVSEFDFAALAAAVNEVLPSG